ncbi:DHX35 [Symbiodinium natans]|uniref:RNA helicase n=1 Tax=Symbiodinium natans TaxID=878477 RepID=A0A812PSI3_9DINO|nr:DHX35 [Symbiodinium natans]
MAFWRPGAPQPAHADPWELDCDAERHRALPVFNSSASLPVQQQRRRLPIARQRLAILHAVETHRAVVLCGATGCGKSTQLPQFLDEAGWTAKGYVVAVTVPRRLAAVTLATRVAQEMGAELGREVGYRIRFDACVSPGSTRIEFMTEGILLREMLSDPLLTRFSVVVIDEAHERSSNTDLLLGLLKKICRKRPRLRLVVASATVDALAFLNFFRRGAKVSAGRKQGFIFHGIEP